MIFLTVGTTKFSFNRLLKAMDKTMIKSKREELLIVQKGVSDYQFKYSKTKFFKEIPFDKMIKMIKKARLVITHAGPATIFLTLKYSQNKPLVIPRLKKFKEHVDDHQLYFVNFLKRKKLVNLATSQNLPALFAQPTKLVRKRKLKVAKQLISRLIKYTETR